MSVLVAFIMLAGIGLLGLMLVGGLLRDTPLHRAERVGLIFGGGYGLTGVLLFDGSLCRCVPGRLELAVILLLAAVVIAVNRPRVNKSIPVDTRSAGKLSTALLAVSVVLIVAAGLNVFAQSLAPGLADIDMFGIWMFRAKLLASRALLPLPGVLTDPTLSYSHQDYPMGMPLVVAAVYALRGRVEETTAMATLLLPIWLSLAAVLYGSIRARVSRAVAAAVTAAFVASPVVVYNAGLAVAELPLVLMHTCTLALLLRWMESGRRSELIATTFFAAFTAMMKNEGLALLPIVGGVGLIFAFTRRRPGWLVDWVWAGVTLAALIGPWVVYRRWLPHTHEDYGGRLGSAATWAATLPRLGTALRGYVGYFWQIGTTGPLWFILALVALLFRGGWRRGPVVMLWLLLAAHWALYLVIFTITPWPLEQLMPMVAPKLLMHVAPAAVLLIGLHAEAGQAADREGVTGATTPGPSPVEPTHASGG